VTVVDAGTGWSVKLQRPHPKVSLFEVALSDYHEFFTVAEGHNTLAITMFEPGKQESAEPQVFVFTKPYGWRDDLEGDEALMQVWQAVGVQR
jgi:hypothetical protein